VSEAVESRGQRVVRKPYTEDDLYEDQQIIRDAEEALPGALALLRSVQFRVDDLRHTINHARARIQHNTVSAASGGASDG
jgi:hypothetical protein